MSQNDSSDFIEQWRSGVEFSFAWYKFADPHALRQFQECMSPGGQQTRKILMVADLWAGLGNGEFQAFGKCVAPEISNGPVLIPTHTFEFEPPRGIEDSNDFEISGWRYEGVKVVRIREIDADVEATLDVQPDPQPTTEPVAVAVAAAVEPIPTVARKRGGGRPDTYQYSESVLRVLYAIDGKSKLSAEKLHKAFEAEFKRQFPRDHFQIDPPNVRTLRKQIERYRKELAETGNN